MPETCGDIAVGAQQIGRAGFGVVALGRQACGIDKTIAAANAERAYALGYLRRRTIAKLQQREPRSLSP